MADNTKIGPIFRGANGGLSDDLFTGIQNSYYYSSCMEIREDAKCIYPMQSPRATLTCDLGEEDTSGRAVACRYFNDGRYVFTQHNVYLLDLENRVGEAIANWIGNLTNEPVVDAELFAGYVYIATTKNLYRISQTANKADWASLGNFDVMNLQTSSYHPLYATDVLMAVGNGNKVSIVRKEILNQVQDGITLQSDYKVKFINELGGFIRVVAEDGYYGAEIIMWDKVSSAASEIIPLNGYRFLQSRVYGGYHYLLSDKGLGLINGYQFYILKRFKNLEEYSVRQNGMVVYDDKLYFTTREGIYIYGAKNKNYPDVLSLRDERHDEYGTPDAIATDGKNILYTESNRSGGVARAHLYAYLWIDGWTNPTSGEFQTMCYFGNSMSEIKQSMYLRIGYLLKKGEIDVYYRTDADMSSENPLDWSWHKLSILKPTSDTRAPFATSIKLNCRFQWIQFKFILRQTMSGLKTRLYSADLYYNDMLD